ncbi:MAG: CusA/CzcA family heavy metal efflux RND transporter [Bacteroidales bacterium]|nr:CusA/CzcA family heavy metal efflux RND transporter [Bacteroidales bacterium]
MLDSIILFSLRNRFFILLTALVLVVWGLYTGSRMDVDVFPDLTAPTVVVMTDAHGMAAEEVERLVTFPIETAVNGATGVRRVRSASSQGFSFVWVEFDWGTDIFLARQIVSEKLITVSAEMPFGVSQPMLAPQSSIMGEIMFISVQADSTSMMELRTLSDWVIKPMLLATSGVSQVTIVGGDYKQYQVLADPYLLKFYDVSLSELASICRDFSNNSSGSVLRQHGNEYVVRGLARTNDLEELGNSFIKSANGQPVRVRDVAEVITGPALKMGHGSKNASPAVIISVSKQPNVNTLELTRRLEENIASVQQTLPPDVEIDTRIFRQADFIERSVRNVQKALVEGAIFVVVILFLFLGSFRTTIISLIAIPISLLGAVLVLNALGLNINTMSLGGMAIAIGSVVDDAIIDVENAFKRLRENYRKPAGEQKSKFMVVFETSKEIRSSILNATLIIIVAFIPLFFLSGMEGRMLRPLGIAYVVSLFVSLLVAMTLIPLLCKLLLTNDRYLSKHEKDRWLAKNLKDYYQRSLQWALGHRRLVIFSALGLFMVSMVVFTTLGRSFLPEFNEGSLTIGAVSRPGTSLEQSNDIGYLIEKELLSIPEVTGIARRTGRGELDEHSQSVNSAEIDVNYELNGRSNESLVAEVREKLSAIPGIAFMVMQPLGHRIDHMLSGTSANIAIKIFGTDLGRMYNVGKQIAAAIGDIEGLVDVNVEQQVEVPQLQIRANRDMLAHYGITIGEFNEFVELAFSGERIGDIYEGQQRFDLILKLNQDYTTSMDGFRSALIDTHDGRKVPLDQVAEIVSATGPSSISRENVQRKVVVSANVAGRDLLGAVNDIQEAVGQQIVLPEGYRIEYGGQFESEARASQTLLLTSIMAIFIIFLLLYQEFRNLRLAGIILINLPLALIGGVFSIYFTSGILSIPAIIGFITLFGIATRNGILLVSRYQNLQDEGADLKETVLLGSVDRLNPILMTALTAALALIPLALQGHLSGNEIQSPMAKVILGGLLTSTLLNIYVVPVVYSLLAAKRPLKKDEL